MRRSWRADREEVDALTGQDRVPVLQLDRDVICDSRRIVEHLPGASPESALTGVRGRA